MSTATATKKATTATRARRQAARTGTKKSQTSKASSDGETRGKQKQTAFEKLFENMLKDIYWAEQHLVDALQEMAEAATTDELQEAFEDHMYITQKHAARLEKVFKLLGKEPEAKKCDAMEGLIEEGKQVIKETEEGSMTRDAGLIIAAQKVEHYEIASYGSLVQVAITLGHDKVASILEMTLNEEEDTDQLLTDIAETYVNPMADNEDEDSSSESEEE
jgi:ferritin-like metal-binding protein YciE